MQAPETSKHLETTENFIDEKVQNWNNVAKPTEVMRNDLWMGNARADAIRNTKAEETCR